MTTTMLTTMITIMTTVTNTSTTITTTMLMTTTTTPLLPEYNCSVLYSRLHKATRSPTKCVTMI